MTDIRVYADRPARRAGQIAGDLAVLAWVGFALWCRHRVDDWFGALADDVREADGAATRLSGGLTDAGDFLGGVPLVGGGIRRPLDGAASAADSLGATALRSAETTETLGFWLGLAVLVLLAAPVLARYVPRRAAYALRATRTARLLAAGADGRDLLALQALAGRPAHRVHARVPGAADGWRRADPAVLAALVAMELDDLGLARERAACNVAAT